MLWAGGLTADELEVPMPASQMGVRNAHFQVFADDTFSAQYVATVGEMLAQRFGRILPPPARFSEPVFVNLVTRDEAGPEASFTSTYFPAGYAVVNLDWGPATRRENVERALAQGHLTHLSAAYGQGAVHVPFWLEVALQHLARVQSVPTHGQSLSGAVQRGRPLRLEEIFAAERGEASEPDFEASAYWLLLFLEREGRHRGQARNFLLRVLRGESAMHALAATFGDQLRSREEAHLWWMVGLSDLIRPAGAPVLSIAESRRRIAQLEAFTVSFGGEVQRVFSEQIWEHRRHPLVREELLRREQSIEIELGLIHPYFRNSLLSLGRLLDAARTEREEEFRIAVNAFRQDTLQGEELAEDTRGILDDLSAELRDQRLGIE